MDLSMHKPKAESFESFPYRHKKFDVHKRPRDEEETPQPQQQQPGLRTEIIIKQCTASPSPPASHFIFNPLFCGGAAERVCTPYSTDSNCSSDYAGFVNFFSACSTPTAKRRRLFTPGTQYTFSPSEDSGISMTPQKQQQQQVTPLKRKLKPSALAEPPAKQQRTSTSSTMETANPTTAKVIVDLTLKQRHNNSNNNNKTNSNNAVSKRKTAQKCSDIKAALKPALKSTPAGTLELDAAKNLPTNTHPLPPAAATVLSRISEDKLRSICKYHGNMVRQFPKKERTPKDQERRNKNTIACRMSRRLKKLEHMAVEVQLKESVGQYVKLMEERLRVKTYLEELAQLTNGLCENALAAVVKEEEEEAEIDVVSVNEESRSPTADTMEWKYQRNEDVREPMKPMSLLASPSSNVAVPMPLITNAFSIAYLMGSLRK